MHCAILGLPDLARQLQDPAIEVLRRKPSSILDVLLRMSISEWFGCGMPANLDPALALDPAAALAAPKSQVRLGFERRR